MDPYVPSEKKSDSDVNGTVVVNMLTLEVAVEDVDTAGEKAGQDHGPRDPSDPRRMETTPLLRCCSAEGPIPRRVRVHKRTA